MASTTSGTTSFSLDVDEIIEEALDPLGGEHTSGISAAKARRKLNLLLITLQAKNVPLNKIEYVSIPLIADTASYTFNADVVDVLELTLKTTLTGVETALERIGIREYHNIFNKTQEGRPTLYSLDRQDNTVKLKLWMVPTTNDTYTAECAVVKRIEDITASYQRLDLPHRYLPLVVAWLAYELAISRPNTDPQKVADLRSKRDDIMVDVFDEDRERVDFIITPGGINGR